MSDPSIDGPTEEEMRAYLESLRNAQPVEIVVQSFGILATASEVKLGMPDARVLIDGMAGLLDATGGHMPEQITERMRQTVAQLQMAQVQAEGQLAQRDGADDTDDGQAGGDAAGARPGTAADSSTPGGASSSSGAAAGQEPPHRSGSDPASRLWIPGRD